MSDAYQVVCPHCHTTNRLSVDKDAKSAKCGKCSEALFEGKPLALTGEAFSRHIGSSDIPVLVDFWAAWCGPCRMMAPIFEQAALELEPQLRLAKVDTEAERELSMHLGIRSIPTLMIFHKGEEVTRQAGAMPLPQLLAWARQSVQG